MLDQYSTAHKWGPNRVANMASISFGIASAIWLVVKLGLPFSLMSVCFAAIIMHFTCICVTIAHELGHLLGGLIQGYKFLYFKAGFIQFYKGADGLKVSFSVNSRIKAMGAAGLIPPRQAGSRMGSAIMILSGPLFNLFLSFLSLSAYLAFENANAWIRFSSGFMGAFSLITFVLAMIPYESSGFMSDGLTLLNYLKSNKHR
jgi:hypothetical protein